MKNDGAARKTTSGILKSKDGGRQNFNIFEEVTYFDHKRITFLD